MGVVGPVIFWANAFVASTYGSYVQTQALTGYGYYPYDPLCGAACLRSFQSYTLGCTEMSGGGDMMVGMMPTSPECYGKDTPYLTSVAYCMSTKCSQPDITFSKLQLFWEEQITGHPDIPPKWTYEQALAHADTSPPMYQLTSNDTSLNTTSIVNPMTYLTQWNVLSAVYRESALESAYSIAIIVLAVGFPIALTCLSYFPFVPTILDKVRPYLVWPSTIGNYQVQPLPYLLGNAPTVGQGIYIAVFLIVNVILSAIEYEPRQPSAWFDTQRREVMAYILYRCGAFAFALFPVVILFSSRNNVLLWLTNWSHSTYLLLHRWVGRLFALYAILHSILGLMVYADEQHTVWWIWGAVATVASVILAVGSGLYVRKAHYELFLISHILLTVFTLVGCWYHLIGWYNSMGLNWPEHHAGGFEVWLYFTCALWFFDRLARVFRVLRFGIRRARVTQLCDGILRVDIPGVRMSAQPGTHVYVYFPTVLPLRPWENHPFSVIPTAMLNPPLPLTTSQPDSFHNAPSTDDDNNNNNHNNHDLEAQKPAAATTTTAPKTTTPNPEPSITLLIRTSPPNTTGSLTTHLHPTPHPLPTLLDGPYHSTPHTPTFPLTDRILLIAGGIGITSLLPWLSTTSPLRHDNVSIKLAWSVRAAQAGLVDSLRGVVGESPDGVGGLEREVRVGGRLDVWGLVAAEADVEGEVDIGEGGDEGGMGVARQPWRVGVVVSGPGGVV